MKGYCGSRTLRGPGRALAPCVLAAGLALAMTAASPAARAAAPAAADADVYAAYNRAIVLYKDGKYAEALEAFEAVLAKKALPEALYNIGRCHHQLAHYREATEAYEKFLAVAPAHASAAKARDYLIETLSTLGNEAVRRGEHEPARAAFARALELRAFTYPAATDAFSGNLLFGLAWALAGLEQRDRALETARRALRAALASDVRAQAEALAADLEAGRRPALLAGGSGKAGPDGPDGPDGPERILDPEPPARKGGSKVGLFIGIGAGAAVVVGGVTVLLVVLLGGTRADFTLDWRDR